MNELKLEKTYWASVSGGKDSLYMLYHILNNLDRYPLNGIVHFELEIDYPFIKNVIDEMEKECKKYEIPFFRIKPRKKWIDMYNKFKYPNRVVKWCNWEYKLDCKYQLNDMMKKQNKEVIYYIGLCANEENRVKKKEYKNSIFPLYEMGVYEETIWKWARTNPIFNDYYKYNKRCGCYNCPMQNMNNTKYNSIYYPNLYIEYMTQARKSEIEVEKKTGKGYSVWQSNSKYNTEYRFNRIQQIELKEIKEW